MLTILARRLLISIPILFAVVTITFFVTRVIPGDPAYNIAASNGSRQLIRQLRHQLGTDQPLLVQYGDFVAKAWRLDFGRSIYNGHPVFSELRERLPTTLELISFALLFALVVGLPAGAFAARRAGRLGDVSIRAGSVILLSLPDFWLGLMLLYAFFFRLRLAPAPFGQLSPNDPMPHRITGAVVWDSILTGNPSALVAGVSHAILPILTLGLIFSAPIARLARSGILEVLEADYIRFGRTCGLAPRILWRYSTRAALPPVVTFVGWLFSAMLGGAVLVETIFSWGGVAQYAAQAIIQSDYPIIQGFIVLSGVMSVATFLIVDLLYVVIDPRVKLTGGSPMRSGSGAPFRKRFSLEPLRARRGLRDLFANASRFAVLTAAVAEAVGDGLIRRVRLLASSTRWHRRILDVLTAVTAFSRRSVEQAWPAIRRGLNVPLVTGFAVITVLIIGCFVVPAISPYGAREPNPTAANLGPSLSHLFGTDLSGFDIATRVFYAPRIDLTIAALGVSVGLLVGVAVGLAVAFVGGVAGEIIMRIADLVQAFPVLILALTLVALSGNKVNNVVWALAFINAPIFLRLFRSRILSVSEQRFIEAAVSLGNSRTRLLFRHILPNSLSPVIVQFGISMGYAMLTIAALAFLGVGIQVPTPEWGAMILIGRNGITTGQWWTAVFPGIMLAVAVAGSNLLSEGLERARDIYR
jgi:ABC-type dipeptide/oligopeptide/nickel transport system permease component